MRLTGAYVGFSGLERVPMRGNLQDQFTVVDVGWQSAAERQVYIEFMQTGAMLDDPATALLIERAGQPLTRLRRELVEDAAWYRSRNFDRYHRGGGCDDLIISHQVAPVPNCMDMITLRGAYGDRPFDWRGKQIVALFHAELSRLWRQPPDGFRGLCRLASPSATAR